MNEKSIVLIIKISFFFNSNNLINLHIKPIVDMILNYLYTLNLQLVRFRVHIHMIMFLTTRIVI